MDISIIIVNWNVRDLLQRLLESIFFFVQDVSYEIIVVDNASSDGSVEMLNAWGQDRPQLRVVANTANLGFSRANNQGLARAQGKYVLFMNPDMELIENSPKALFEYLEAHPQVACATCKLVYGDGTLQPNIKRDPTALSQLWLLYKLHHFYQPRFFKRYLARDFDYETAQPVEQIMGALVCIRRELIVRMGGWSEDYFIWWEDLDLCKRLRNLHELIMYVPDTRIIHYESKSFAQQLSLAKQKRFNRGLLTYFKKYHGRAAWFLLKLASWDSLVLAWLAQVLKFRSKTQSQL